MKRILFLASFMLCCMISSAAVRPSHLFSDNAVLQQDSDVRIWGWADGKKVSIAPSWTDRTTEAKVGKDGRWSATIRTPKAGFTPYEIVLSDGEETVIRNLLIGEVWIAGGQSNMEMPLKGFDNCPVDDFNAAVAESALSRGLRFLKIPSRQSMIPLEDTECEWKDCTPDNVAEASAVAYFFSRLVNMTLGVPVGVIEANKGGSRVESWLSRENLENFTEEDLSEEAMAKFRQDYMRPLVWGYGTMSPVEGYTARGFIFYQGCSNVGDHGDKYSSNLARMVAQWRESFGQGDLPFYFVEIAPYDDYGGNGPLLREQQKKAEGLIPNSFMITTNDCVYPYETRQIHPAQKKKVGERLAYSVLSKTYGIKGFAVNFPQYNHSEKDGDAMLVYLDNLEGGIGRSTGLTGFEVAGEDRVFHPAEVTQERRRRGALRVSSSEVPDPVAVRYCFKDFQVGNFTNGRGLPLIPFRSDDWQ